MAGSITDADILYKIQNFRHTMAQLFLEVGRKKDGEKEFIQRLTANQPTPPPMPFMQQSVPMGAMPGMPFPPQM